jgi:hypothetical protein
MLADASRHAECAHFLLTNSVAICLLRCPPLEEFLLRFSLSLSLFLLMAVFSITHFWARFSLGTKQQDSALGAVQFRVPSERVMLKEREVSL